MLPLLLAAGAAGTAGGAGLNYLARKQAQRDAVDAANTRANYTAMHQAQSAEADAADYAESLRAAGASQDAIDAYLASLGQNIPKRQAARQQATDQYLSAVNGQVAAAVPAPTGRLETAARADLAPTWNSWLNAQGQEVGMGAGQSLDPLSGIAYANGQDDARTAYRSTQQQQRLRRAQRASAWQQLMSGMPDGRPSNKADNLALLGDLSKLGGNAAFGVMGGMPA